MKLTRANRVHAADRRKDLPAYVADVESLMHEAVLSQVKTKCAYALKVRSVTQTISRCAKA